MRRRYYFVYIVPHVRQLDIRCPQGGVSVRARNGVEGINCAYTLAEQRYAVRPTETLVVVEQRTVIAKRQCELLELSKKVKDNKFKIAMLT